jgi:Zn-dependent protease with chaperone function
MTTAGKGIYFDGSTSARHEVAIELAPASVIIRAADGHVLAEWPYDELEHLSAPDHMLRVGRLGSPVLARLEVHDPTLAAALDEHAVTVDRTGASERRGRLKVVFWSVAATVSLVLVAIFGIPRIAELAAPVLPYWVEARLGQAVDTRIRSMLDTGKSGKPFECGTAESEKAGKAAFTKMVDRLEGAAQLPFPLKVAVVRRPEANAIALPGGHIYVFQGLINKSDSADELAGVLGHEIGHVAYRHGTKSVLRAAGLSFLFGMLLGDFVGGGAVIIAAKAVMTSAYSRDAETAADLYSAELMSKVGGDPRALGVILTRITGSKDPSLTILLNHPVTKDRVAIINAATAGKSGGSLLTPAEWQALRRVCSG